MRELFTVMGLVIQLAASFLLAARGFTHHATSQIWLSRRAWHIVLLPGLFSTAALVIGACIDLQPKNRAVLIFLLGLVCAADWVPSLAKHTHSFIDSVDTRKSDLDIERLNRHGFLLLALGFAVSTLGAVL